MKKKEKLKIKKDEQRKIREFKLYRKRNYKETVDYAIDCFLKEVNS